MPPLTVNWSDLEIAFERNSPSQESFLDLENGDLLSIIEGEPDAAARRARVAHDPERYARVDPASSREQYRWMERFVTTVQDPVLRERLLGAIDGKGAFRRFKDALLVFPAERERWFAFRAELLHLHIQTWLGHTRTEVANPCPWGHIVPQADPAEPPRPAPETPGLGLRQQASQILGTIPASELPTTIVFLEFLRDRGAALRASLAVDPVRPSSLPPPAPESSELDEIAAVTEMEQE